MSCYLCIVVQHTSGLAGEVEGASHMGNTWGSVRLLAIVPPSKEGVQKPWDSKKLWDTQSAPNVISYQNTAKLCLQKHLPCFPQPFQCNTDKIFHIAVGTFTIVKSLFLRVARSYTIRAQIL